MNPSSSLRQNAHAVIIGIDKYQDQKIPNLTFAAPMPRAFIKF